MKLLLRMFHILVFVSLVFLPTISVAEKKQDMPRNKIRNTCRKRTEFSSPPKEGKYIEEFVNKADINLYRAKEHKNQVFSN